MYFQLPFDRHWFLRFALGTVFLYHGLTKNLKGFAKDFKLPIWLAVAVIFAEVSAGIGYLLDGIYPMNIMGYSLTQLASLAAIPVLLGAIYLVHWNKGFNVMKGGYEFQFVVLMMSLYMFFNY